MLFWSILSKVLDIEDSDIKIIKYQIMCEKNLPRDFNFQNGRSYGWRKVDCFHKIETSRRIGDRAHALLDTNPGLICTIPYGPLTTSRSNSQATVCGHKASNQKKLHIKVRVVYLQEPLKTFDLIDILVGIKGKYPFWISKFSNSGLLELNYLLP